MSPAPFPLSRREILSGAGVLLGSMAAPVVAVTTERTIAVSGFYRADHGRNLQPALQAALDAARSASVRKIVNDVPAKSAELWCPVRRSPPKSLEADGIPLVVRAPVDIDFGGTAFTLRGPGGGSRNQAIAGTRQPWLGGWLYVVGYPEFDRIGIANVVVEGGYTGSFTTNDEVNLTDKGFRIHDTNVTEVYLRNVELRNFGGEIYYIGGTGPQYQQLDDCHFHGSSQCAFNPGGNGTLKATNLRAGRAYQVAEVLGGKGQLYVGGLFYGAGNGGGSFMGGPSPDFRRGRPFYEAYWDGQGSPPYIRFDGTRFEQCHFIRLGSWMRGNIQTLDTTVKLVPTVGHLRDVDLTVDSTVDSFDGLAGVGLTGPPDAKTPLAKGLAGAYLLPPSDIRLGIRCLRTARAVAQGKSHECGLRLYGGMLDGGSISAEISGEAHHAWEVFHGATPPNHMPRITTTGFRTI